MLKWTLWLAAVSVIWAAPFNSEFDEQWHLFKKTYNRNYHDSEEHLRRKIFEDNINFIVQHNLEADLGKHKFRLGITHFADLTHEEYAKRTSCLSNKPIRSPTVTGKTFVPPPEVQVPDDIDWVKKGYVTGVKDQGMCGSCYAFASTGALEGQHMKATGKLVSLSEQNIVDCSGDYGNKGCDGGMPDGAFVYVIKNGGIDTEESYPYEEEVESCRFKEANTGATCNASVAVQGGDETIVKMTLAVTGPLAVGIDASSRKLQLYKEGIYEDKDCSKENLNHAVLMVGYGEQEGTEYWKVKNSWGTEWGMEGYFLIARNMDSMCGIAEAVFFPMV